MNAIYDPKVSWEDSRFFKFVKEIVAEKDVILLQEISGYLLSRDTSQKKAFMFLGGGDNGKSAFLSFIRTFLKDSNVSSISLNQLEEDRFSAIELFGKIVNINADLGTSDLIETSRFKQLTGGEAITADRK